MCGEPVPGDIQSRIIRQSDYDEASCYGDLACWVVWLCKCIQLCLELNEKMCGDWCYDLEPCRQKERSYKLHEMKMRLGQTLIPISTTLKLISGSCGTRSPWTSRYVLHHNSQLQLWKVSIFPGALAFPATMANPNVASLGDSYFWKLIPMAHNSDFYGQEIWGSLPGDHLMGVSENGMPPWNSILHEK
jgi:hypothetical protein